MKLIWKLRLMKDTRGQDLIEYALMAGFVAVAAGAIMPGVAAQIHSVIRVVASLGISDVPCSARAGAIQSQGIVGGIVENAALKAIVPAENDRAVADQGETAGAGDVSSDGGRIAVGVNRSAARIERDRPRRAGGESGIEL